MDKFKATNLFHVFFVSILFIYVGFTRNQSPDWIYTLLLITGIGVIAYHLYGAYAKIAPTWIHALHFLLVGPLLVYVGLNGKETGRMYYEMMLLLGFAALGYHGLNYIRY
jgi:hypothetical protein